MFAGYVSLDGEFQGMMVTRLATVPSAPDSPPSFTTYAPGGAAMSGGTGTCTKFLSDAGLYEFSIDALGSAGFEVGTAYTIVFRYTFSAVAYLDYQTFLAT
jgi:hypothetical protein